MKYNAEVPNGWVEAKPGDMVSSPVKVNWVDENTNWIPVSLSNHRMESAATYRLIYPSLLPIRTEW